ncbi:MAG: M14 family metallopeptidase [Acidobacteria bacterium]|nr:M14 family metallopeptidase [Candidatus Sulfomarinibacter sp. MAG AM1]
MKRLFVLFIALFIPCLTIGADDFPDQWLTVAEKTDFRATSSYDETMTFLRKAEAAAPELIRVTDFGRSAQGRPLPLVIVSTDGAFTPQAAAGTGKPVVLMQSCIHAGEVDGKDATLMILRDLALGRRPDLAKGVIILFAPIYNADGHERVSPYNRSNQNGPVEGMGYRATADGINLNRDFLRLASPEARAMAGLVATWNPDLHVDNHVTNGSDHAWVLTWLVAEAPQLDPAVDAWVDAHLPKVLAATAAAGHPNGPYVDLVSRTDPAAGMLWDVAQPRYSSGYFPLRNRPSILIEMHAHKPFRDRVYANRSFMEELIGEVGRSGKELVRAVTAADAATISRGRADAEPSEVVVRWGVAEEGDTLTWPAYEWTVEDSVTLGGRQVRYHPGEIREVDLEWRHAPVPELELPRPRGYLVLSGWPQIEEVVAGHGLRAYRIEKVAELEVETIRLSKPEFATFSYQGVVMVENFDASRRTERRTIPAGSLWIPADQPNFEIAVQLFEPEAPDSLVRWGAVSSLFERKIYIGTDVLEGLAREMLADDVIRREWEVALDDPDFAANRSARYLWWYRRTPYWDETVGLLPVLRVMQPTKFEFEAVPGT